MSSKCKAVGNFLKNFDLFPATQFLRYKGDPDYTTATGAITSLIILTVFCVMFASMGLQTAQREIIFASTSSSYESNPSESKVKAGADGKFMFGIAIMNLNLSDTTTKYFNITLTQNYYGSSLSVINQTNIPLEQCTEDHFGFTEDIKRTYNDWHGTAWLCPPLNQEFDIKGKVSSNFFNNFQVKVMSCDTGVDSRCLDSANLPAVQAAIGGEFQVVIPVINSVINAGDKQYKLTILEDRNVFSFTTTSGLRSHAYVEEVLVKTDVSLLPYTQYRQEKLISIPDYFKTSAKSAADETYLQLVFQKSPVSTTHIRSFNKVDSYFSYVGGLIGTILGFMFVMGAYSERAYSISIGSQLFLTDEGGKIPSQGFHVGYLFTLITKQVLNLVGCDIKWKKTSFYERCLDQIDQQLDITTILRRLLFVEKAIFTLFDDHQINGILLQGKEALDCAEKKRKKFNVRDKVIYGIGEDDSKVSENEQKEQSVAKNAVAPLQQASAGENCVELSAVTLSKMSHSPKEELKDHIRQLINQSNSGMPVSQRIVAHIDPEVMVKLGFGMGESELAESHIQAANHANLAMEGTDESVRKLSSKSNTKVMSKFYEVVDIE